MYIKKLFILMIVSISVIYADGPLSLKGFHSNMSYEEGCKNMSKLPIAETYYGFIKGRDYSFIEGREQFNGHKACGWGIGKFDAHKEAVYKYSIFFSDDRRLFINSNFVDGLFASKNMNIDEFSQSFINNYSWIDRLEPIVINQIKKGYKYRSVKYGWEIKITIPIYIFDKLKTINIKFFDPPKPKFD